MAYNIKIEEFEGPMDLLLHLIQKNKIDIYDIPINKITDQYLEYVDKMNELNLELAGDFLVMASTLIEIKSKMLLPMKSNDQNSDELEEDPRDALVSQLIEYKKYKEVSEYLREKDNTFRYVYYKPMEDFSDIKNDFKFENIDKDKLFNTLNKLIEKKIRREKKVETVSIYREKWTIESCSQTILKKLEDDRMFNFSSFFDDYNSIEWIITCFLALLELIKSRLVRARQNDDFSDIIVFY